MSRYRGPRGDDDDAEVVPLAKGAPISEPSTRLDMVLVSRRQVDRWWAVEEAAKALLAAEVSRAEQRARLIAALALEG